MRSFNFKYIKNRKIQRISNKYRINLFEMK